MPRRTLPALFRSWAFKSKNLTRRQVGFTLRLEDIEERIAPATLPAPTVTSSGAAVLPRQDPTAANNNTTIDYINPQVVASPINPLNQVMVATSAWSQGGAATLGAVAEYSTDGGQTWSKLTLPDLRNQGVLTSQTATTLRDPSLAPSANPNTFTNASSPSVAFGRDGTVYFVYLVHNAAKTSGAVLFAKGAFGTAPAGAVTLYQWDGADSAGNPVDPALNPVIAVDNNDPSFTDPQTFATYTDTMVNGGTSKSKAVYIAWNGNIGASAVPGDLGNTANTFNPNAIQAVVSADDGATWSNPTPVSDGGFLTSPTKRGAAPQIAFSPGNSGAPGSLVFVWAQQVKNANDSQIVYDSTQPDGGVAGNSVPQAYTAVYNTSNNPTQILDAAAPPSSPPPPPNTPDIASVQTFPLLVDPSIFTDPNFTLQDLSIDLSLVAPNLDQLSITLQAPNGNSIVLLNNHTNGLGNAVATPGGIPLPPGVPPPPAFSVASPPPPAAGLGVLNGVFSQTIFDDNAALRINDPKAAYPYIGEFRPEGALYANSDPASSYMLTALGLSGAAGGALAGTWTLTVKDFRNDRYTLNNATYVAPEYLHAFNITFSSVKPGGGTDHVIAGTTAVSIGTDFNNAPLTGVPNYPGVAAAGIAPAVSVAFDASVGSNTPYGGQMYVAYTGVKLDAGGNPVDTNINLVAGKMAANGAVAFGKPVQVNDDAQSDNFTEGNRPQFTPAVTVDPTTGTVVVTWYDARLDANGTRASTFIATSIDGGQTFSDQTFSTTGDQPFLNQPKQAIDVITGTTYTLEPVPTNVPLSNATYGLGIRGSVMAYGGIIYAYWAGNLNAAGSGIFGAEAVTADGPRLVSGDLGPVTQSTTVGGFDQFGNPFQRTYNASPPGPDGTQGIDAFVVTVDRPIDPSQFLGLDQAQLSAIFDVQYRSPYTPLSSTSTQIPVSSVEVFYPTDPTTTPPSVTELLVHLATAQYGVGTYSYAVGPAIVDRVQSVRDRFFSADTPKTIASGSSSTTVTSSLNIPTLPVGTPAITGVQVTVNVTEQYDDNISLALIGPDGTVVPLRTGNGSTSTPKNNFDNTTFADSAVIPIAAGTAPFTGSFRPVSPLSAFAGKSPSGTWSLRVIDLGGGAAGVLREWSLQLLTSSGVLTFISRGNEMDQNANASPGEGRSAYLTPPTGVTAAPPIAGGSFAAGVYYWVVTATTPTGTSIASAQVTASPGTNQKVTISWNPVAGATSYQLYRTTTSGQYGLSSLAAVIAGGTTSYIDLGAATTAGTPQAGSFDGFSMPSTSTGLPFTSFGQQPVAVNDTSEPLIIPGPRLIDTTVPGSASDLVDAGVATEFDLTFDRDINAASFTNANVIRITGPAGVIYDRATATTNPLTVTPFLGSFNPGTGGYRKFAVGFPAQALSGTYTVEIDSQIAAAVTIGGQPVLVDTNMNAGLDLLRGTASAPGSGTPSSLTYSASFSGPSSTIPAAVGTVPGVVDFPITVPDQFAIAVSAGHQIEVQLNVSSATAVSQHVTDLTAQLIAPNGTVVQLFSGVGNPLRTPGKIWFSNTILADSANTPIQQGFQPFDSGPYNPQFSLATAFSGTTSQGTWTLRIFNTGLQTPNLTSWALILPKISGGTGMGEPVADEISTSIKLFNQDPTNPLTQDVWTPVGPASENGGANSARTNAIAVDPSDPSGNTVYIGAASGGVWKTTNFLTSSSAGPTWIPLTDAGPTYSLNVVSIAVFPRNNDPNQSIIFALTGEGDTGSIGVGVLRSMDGGKTWVVLDSKNNSNGAGGVSSIDAATRNHQFFGATQFKIVVDPTPVADAAHDVIVYLAGAEGVWRSNDTGLTWTQLTTPTAGTATDIVLSAGSAGSTGNLQVLYAAIEGQGIFMANPAFAAGSMVQLTGTPGGNGSFIDSDLNTNPRVPIAQPFRSPNANEGRIVLAAPAATSNTLQNQQYAGWLYALVIDKGGNLYGLFLTKDYGQNWTMVDIPEFIPGGSSKTAYGTNDYTLSPANNYNPFGGGPGQPLPSQGNYDVAMAIDPLNPNVVYIGGTNDGTPPTLTGFIRVDTTGIMDAAAIVAYENSAKGSNAVQLTANTGNVVTKAAGTKSQVTGANLGPGTVYGVVGYTSTNTGLLNVLRDPNNPFETSSPVFYTNVASIQNLGTGARYQAFPYESGGDIHRIVTMVDPTTGLTRVIVGDDHGVATEIADASGNGLSQIGTSAQNYQLAPLARSGNLQTLQMYSGTAQPSQLAAEIAGAMFYSEAQDDGSPAAYDPSILQDGSIGWSGPKGDGSWVLTDQTGSGTEYTYQWPCCGGNGNNFFAVNGIGRTLFLVQPGDNPSQGTGQWPLLGGDQFAVNPVDSQGLLISSGVSGRLFRSTDQGRTWFVIAGDTSIGTTNLGGYAPAVAFGAPDPAAPNQLDNFIYAGTSGGQVWVSFTGGGSSWKNISSGISGSVEQIIPDPVRGTRDAYAVTSSGVFYMPDSSSPTAAWVPVTGNLFSLSKPIFGDPNATPVGGDTVVFHSLSSLAVDWRYAIPVDPKNPALGTYPILYAAGDGGVARSVDDGKTWQLYPQGTTYTYTDPTTGQPVTINTPAGGYFPSIAVTQLTLSLGNIDPATGQPLQQTGGLDLLTASTYGRGAWVIRLGTPANDPVIAGLAKYQVVAQSGPQVIGVDVVQQPTAGTGYSGTLKVEFNAPVLASTFTTGQIQLKDAAGNPLTITGVTPLVNATAPQGFPTVPGTPTDYHNLFQVTFTAAQPVAAGFASVVIGQDASGTMGIADYAGFLMDQNNNGVNGQAAADPNNGGFAADAYAGSLYLSSVGNVGNLNISMATTATAGSPTKVTVSDLDPSTGKPVAGYTGTVTLSATIGGSAYVLTNAPALGLATLSEDGAGNVTVTTNGTVAFAAGDVVEITGVGTAGYNGTFKVTSVSASGFTYVNTTLGLVPDIDGLGSVTKLVPVAAQSASAAPAGGPLSFNYKFTAADAGTHVFSIYFLAASAPPNQTLFSVTDTTWTPANPLLAPNPAQASITVLAGHATQFVLTGLPNPYPAGTAGDLTVAATDPYGNIDPTYTGTATLTITDGNGKVKPVTYQFTGAGPGNDNGSHTFPGGVVFTTIGLQTVTATDATNAPTITLTGSETVLVIPGPAKTMTVTVATNPVVAGTADDVTVTLYDAYGNVATGFAGTVTFTSDDLYPATFNPLSYTFTSGHAPGNDNGTHTFPGGVTLFTAGKRSVTATDSADGLTGTATGIQVIAAMATSLKVSGFPSPTTAGVAHDFTVTAYDPYGNVATGYLGTVTFSTTDPLGTFSPATTYPFTAADAGTKTFTAGATLRKAGTWSISATDGTLSATEFNIVVNPAAAASMTVTGFPDPVVAGTAGTVLVQLFDPYGNTATGYTGTVHFTSTDGQAALPANYTFTAGDAGKHTFPVTLKTAGTSRTGGAETITATDTVKGSLTGSQTVTVNPSPITDHFAVAGFPNPVVAGTPGTFTVTAVDPYGNTTVGYTGTVTFTSTDGQAVLPSDYTFVPGDAGVHTFTNGATLKTAGASRAGGAETITATDTVTGTITGSQTVTVNPAAASTLTVTGFPDPVVAGTAGTVTVQLFDPYGNTATGYTGTVHFTSTDGQAALPANYTFTAVDKGVHTFPVTLKTAGTSRTGGAETISVVDTVNGSLAQSQTVTVNPAAASLFTVAGFPDPVVAGTPGTVTVTAFDPYGNYAVGYTGTVRFTSTDGQAALPANYTFAAADAGVHTFSVTLKTAGASRTGGAETITAADSVSSSVTGSQTVTVNPAAAATLTLTGFTNPVVAGTAGTVTVTAYDPFGNVAVGYAGTVQFTSTDGQADLPADYPFVAADKGVHTFPVTLKTAGTSRTGGAETITATDTATGTITGSQTVTVNPAAAASMTVTGFPSPLTAGFSGAFKVTALDPYGNVAVGYTGTVRFTSTDGQAVLPANYTFFAADKGVHTFSAVLETAGASRTGGAETITATDTATGTITGSQTVTVNPAAAATLTLTGLSTPTVAGTAATITVTALDAYGNVAVGYTGAVQFTSTDGQADLPANYSFVAADKGVHTFPVTLKTAGATKKGGAETVTVTDTATGSITGAQTVTVNPAAASTLTLTGFPTAVVAGTAGSFTVTLTDPYGNFATGYTGTVTFSTSDPKGTFSPASTYSFTAADAGVHTFTNGATLKKTGTWAITATDAGTPALTGSETGITVSPAAAAVLSVSGFPTTVTAGTQGSFTVTALDPYGNVATGYLGTAVFFTTDPLGSLNPQSYTFTAADAGAHTFVGGARLREAGSWAIIATDSATPSLTGSESGITVTPAAATTLTLAGYPTADVAGAPGAFTVTAYDPFGNVATGYTGTVTFSTSDPKGTFSPASATFTAADKGMKTFSGGATLFTAGPQSLTATDTGTPTITGTEDGIAVTAAAASTLSVSGFPKAVVAGTAGSFTVTLTDPYGNIATGYRGTVTFSTADPQGAFSPASYPFTAADAGVHTFTNGATLKKTGTWALTATDAGTPALTGSETGITVSPAAASRFVVAGYPTAVTAGTANGFTVTATDAFGNLTPGYTGTVTFSTSDPRGTFSPTTATFTAADAGVKTFAGGATLVTAGPQSITATDAVNGVAGSEGGIVVGATSAATLTVTGFPSPVTAGAAGSFTVTLTDPYGNVATGYRGTVTFSTSDPQGSFAQAGGYTFTVADAGTHTFTGTLRTAGPQSVTAADAAAPGLTGTQVGVQVRPAATARFVLGGIPPTVKNGATSTLTVTAVDAFGNTTPGYTGTVVVTSTDPSAGLPAPSPLNAGVGTFNVVLSTPGAQSVRATDATTPGVAGNVLLTTVQPPLAVSLPDGYAVGSGAGGSPNVLVYNNTGQAVYGFSPFGPGFAAGVRVSVADVTGDGTPDYVVGTGPGVPTAVQVIDGKTHQVVLSYQPFESSFTGGVFVTTGDVQGTGVSDIVITPDEGGGPRVVILEGRDFKQVANFFGIDDPNFRGGARAAVGDITGDGYGDVVVAAGFGGGPRVSVFDGKALAAGKMVHPFNDFFVFGGTDAINLRDGAFIAAGDVNGDGYADIIAGGGPGGGPRVRIISGKDLLNTSPDQAGVIADFFAGSAESRGGIRVAVKNLDGDRYADLVTGDGETEGSTVTAYSGSSLTAGGLDTLSVFDPYPGFEGGVYVG